MSTGKKLKWAIMVTGWGRNAKDLIDASTQGKLKNSELGVLVYEALPSGAVEAATQAGIETLRVERINFGSAVLYQEHIIRELQHRQIDYIFLLSYKYIIRPPMLSAFPNRIINIHPSLFPSFLATTKAIQEALDFGVEISGITTHIIDDKIDQGTILCQEPIRFSQNETFDSVYPKFAKKGKKIVLRTIEKIEDIHMTPTAPNPI